MYSYSCAHVAHEGTAPDDVPEPDEMNYYEEHKHCTPQELFLDLIILGMSQ